MRCRGAGLGFALGTATSADALTPVTAAGLESGVRRIWCGPTGWAPLFGCR